MSEINSRIDEIEGKKSHILSLRNVIESNKNKEEFIQRNIDELEGEIDVAEGDQGSVKTLETELKELRKNNISSELYPNNDKIKKQMNYANNKGVQFVVMIGEDEMKSGQLTTKNMSTGEQKVMSISEFIKIFQ
mgnify:CR=1 FL=1